MMMGGKRSTIAHDLHTPKYRQRVVPDKRLLHDEDWEYLWQQFAIATDAELTAWRDKHET